MDFFKFGLVNLLGIIGPGAMFLGGIILGMVGFLEFYGMVGYRAALQKIVESEFLTTVIFLIISYHLGSAIRLFANDITEVASSFYSRRIRRKRADQFKERFPYPIVTKWIAENVDLKIAEYLKSKNADFDKEGNKNFYNYCKMHVQAHSQVHFEICERIEAYVRFLAGSFIASCFTTGMSFIMAILFFSSGRNPHAILFVGILLVTLTVMIAVLERFGHQHRREVMYMWIAFYECSHKDKQTECRVDRSSTPPAQVSD